MARWIMLGVGCGVVVGAACSIERLNLSHCHNNAGDAYCRSIDESTPYCALPTVGCDAYDPAVNENGCVATRPSEDQCYSPCGTRAGEGCDAGGGTSSGNGEASSTSGADTDDSSGSTGPLAECLEDADCGSDRPLCYEDRCVRCDETALPDNACTRLDPSTPFCEGGSCVQCRDGSDCGSEAPLCDPSLSRCVGCLHHAQCPESACDIAVGECIEVDKVRYVDPVEGQPENVGTSAMPFASIEDGLAKIDEGDRRVLILRGSETYDEYVYVRGNRTVVLKGDPQGDNRWSFDAEEMLKVDRATVYLVDVTLRANADGPAIRVVGGGALWVDQSSILQNFGGGIVVSEGSSLALRNSFVGTNGSELSPTRGIDVLEESTVDILYSTVAANQGNSDADSLACDESSSTRVRNSIVLGQGSSIDCPMLEVSHSVIDTSVEESSVEVVEGLDPAWFENAPAGDFHVAPAGTPFEDVALWMAGDPPTDIDGDARPDTDGTPDFAGADR